MHRLRRIARITAAIACMMPLFATSAAADTAAEIGGLAIKEVRVYARDAETGEDLAWVNPGDTLILPPRVEVRLRMEAIPYNKGPRYPSASYVVRETKPVAGIPRANAEMGSATLQTYGRTGRTTVHYSILDRSLKMPDDVRNGHFIVSVEETVEVVAPAEPVEEHSLMEALYRGILLRDPEPAAVASGNARIQRGGHPEAVIVASQIASSEESQEGVYSRGATPEQRLEALYRHLLGIEPDDVDPDLWRSDLRWMRSRNVNTVVSRMVRSEKFQERFGFRAAPDVREVRDRRRPRND